MNLACDAFRSQLEELLVGRAAAGQLDELAWHEHLLSCQDCRALLASEQALELLLSSLPEPRLEPEVARRLLLRLRHARGLERLDHLLELNEVQEPPRGLSARVLERVARERAAAADLPMDEREARLDRLLDRALGEVEVPTGLSALVLRRLSLARAAQREAESAVPSARAGWFRPRNLAAAAALLALVGGASSWLRGRPKMPAEGEQLAQQQGTKGSPAASDVPDELLASLDVLESWDALEATGGLQGGELGDLEASDLLVLELLAEVESELGPGSGLREDGR